MNESNGSALAVVEHLVPTVGEHHRKATDVAGLVRAIVVGKAVKIGPRSYVPVDAYQAIANAMGCVASARDVKRVEGGYTAIGEVKRLSDGAVLAEGEGFVGDDEPKWKNGPEYARRSMVQTRAIGRACRAAFAFVVPMIDLGLSSTPAEEMEGVNGGTETPPPPAGANDLKNRMKPTPPGAKSAADGNFRPDRPAPIHDRTMAFKFGRDKGKPLSEIEDGSLKWFESKLANDLADASKAQYHAETTQQLATLRAELAYRGLA